MNGKAELFFFFPLLHMRPFGKPKGQFQRWHDSMEVKSVPATGGFVPSLVKVQVQEKTSL